MLTITLLWAFLFSPFQHLRFTVPVLGCILMNGYYDWLYGPNVEDDDEDEEQPVDEEKKEPLLLN
jgi:hypothetical protein